MPNDTTIDHLNHLIDINRDAEAGLNNAADSIRNSELETLFRGYARHHATFATELRAELDRLSGNSSRSGTSSGPVHHGVVHRAWMDLKSALSGHSAQALLTSCQDGEQSAESAYLDAADEKPTGQTHTLIEKHRKQIVEIRTRLARLVGEVKDGLEFPDNE